MKLNIIDISTSAMRAVNLTLRSMANLELNSMPNMRRDALMKMMIITPVDVFSSLVEFQQKKGDIKADGGGIVVYIPRTGVGNIFKEAFGIDMNSDEGEIMDICGEFCNVVAGRFKTELVALGYDEVIMSTPKNYVNSVNLELDVPVSCKYAFGFSKDGKGLLSVDVFMSDSA